MDKNSSVFSIYYIINGVINILASSFMEFGILLRKFFEEKILVVLRLKPTEDLTTLSFLKQNYDHKQRLAAHYLVDINVVDLALQGFYEILNSFSEQNYKSTGKKSFYSKRDYDIFIQWICTLFFKVSKSDPENLNALWNLCGNDIYEQKTKKETPTNKETFILSTQPVIEYEKLKAVVCLFLMIEEIEQHANGAKVTASELRTITELNKPMFSIGPLKIYSVKYFSSELDSKKLEETFAYYFYTQDFPCDTCFYDIEQAYKKQFSGKIVNLKPCFWGFVIELDNKNLHGTTLQVGNSTGIFVLGCPFRLICSTVPSELLNSVAFLNEIKKFTKGNISFIWYIKEYSFIIHVENSETQNEILHKSPFNWSTF